ncbi:phosphotransferase [Mycobacterium sp. pUA109]|uniref:phosphotransferase n=1 Tax=Mycobacterium sp. pUA109 TaxID=3238982 RepID=UPI00351B9D94
MPVTDETLAPAETPEDLTPDWLTSALQHDGVISPSARVTGVEATTIGTGQLGSVVRCTLTHLGSEGPPSVIVKLPSTDEGSRQLGAAVGVYESEVRFFREIASTVDIRVPDMYFAALESGSGRFTLVLEDLGGFATVGDMIAGATPEQAELALAEFAGLQAPRWNDPELTRLPWLADTTRTRMLFAMVAPAVKNFVERFGERLNPRHVDLVRRLAPLAAQVPDLVWRPPFVVCHGDYRLDNMMFGNTEDAPPITVIDWQVVRLGPPLLDAATFLASCVEPEWRRANEHRLLDGYHRRLLDSGVSSYSSDDVRECYRRCSLYPLLLAVAMSVTLQRTDRGDMMWARLVSGAAELVTDTGATEVLG